MNKKEQLLIEIEKSILYVPCDMDEKKELMIKYEQSIDQLINSVEEEQWISVEDERRSTDWFNVVCRNNKNVTKARYFKGEWYKNHRIITDVTHWQLLPQPPKE